MFNGCSKYLTQEIFSFIGIIKTIDLIKVSKKFINILDIKDCINMINFCKIYYQNDNQKPSLYILLEHFKSILSKENFIEIYVHFMNEYIKNNQNEIIELDMLLDMDIIKDIKNKKLLKTNNISLIISSLNILFNQDLNVRKIKNIKKIYFNIVESKEFNDHYSYNNIILDLNEENHAIDYLLFLKYFERLIPETISEINFSSHLAYKINNEKLYYILKI